MLNQVMVDYLQRFNHLMTESVYASKGIQDYSRMKRYSDYLDYDKQTLFRDKAKSEAGLRNIACYLNVILQLLFHVNYLRQKIFLSEHNKSGLIKLLRKLFGQMAVGKLAFADPTDLFQYLKQNNADIFVPGVQNDFHQIFTLLIDKMSESYRDVSAEESKFIKKLLFGRMMTKIDYLDGKVNKETTFNIINLDVAQNSFDKAFQKWKNYQIEGYETPKGNRIDANAQNILLETPALMIFFINRVTFKNNKLQKDSRNFKFQENILVSKAQSEKARQTRTSKNAEVERQLVEQKNSLLSWIAKINTQRDNLEATLKYLRSKDAPLLSEPHVSDTIIKQVDNHSGEEELKAATLYIERQIHNITKKVEDVSAEIKRIEERVRKLEEEGNYESYLLWAVMIHEGASAVHGHYKVCIKINESWFQYNDRIVKSISSSAIEEYKARGQICCLFYRRPTLMCSSQGVPIPMPLKTLVVEQEQRIKEEIDKARLLQCLYQQTESANILLEHQIHSGGKQRYQYFFQPLHYALSEKFDLERCKGILIMETLLSGSFQKSLANKLVSSQTDVNFQRLKFGIPDEYFVAGEVLKSFLSKEASILQLPAAYEELASKRIKFSYKNIRERYNQMLQIIVFKGIYYLRILSQNHLIDLHGFNQLTTSIDKILESMDPSSEFTLVSISIKSSIHHRNGSVRGNKSMLKGLTIENYGDYFSQNFRFWIEQRSNLSKIDESNFFKHTSPISAQKQ